MSPDVTLGLGRACVQIRFADAPTEGLNHSARRTIKTGGKYYYTWTENLERIIRAGHEAGYNRQIGTDIALNPKGRHLIGYEKLHEHIAGREVEPHYRVEMLLSTMTHPGPLPVLLDMSREDRDTFMTSEKNRHIEATEENQ